MTVVDTNSLIYASFEGSPFQDSARAALVRLALVGPLALTRQVLREALAVMTRPQAGRDAVPTTVAMERVEAITRAFTVLEDGPKAWAQLAMLARNVTFAGKQVHDANIVATMLAHGATRLLTFDRHFERFSPWITVVSP